MHHDDDHDPGSVGVSGELFFLVCMSEFAYDGESGGFFELPPKAGDDDEPSDVQPQLFNAAVVSSVSPAPAPWGTSRSTGFGV